MQVYVLRHAIAEERSPRRRDEDRALTDEGREKLTRVLARARKAQVAPEVILTSPYVRAVETAEMAAGALGGKVVRSPALEPESSPERIWEEICKHRDRKAVMVTGHEPLLSAALAYLLGAPVTRIELKKSALARVDFDRLQGAPVGELKWLLTPGLA